jgi:hypothetical protein
MRRRAAELAWECENPEAVDEEWFRTEVVPRLASVSASQLARLTGLSVGYCSRVAKGVCRPHPRSWSLLAQFCDG